jgi:hypothetical protein
VFNSAQFHTNPNSLEGFHCDSISHQPPKLGVDEVPGIDTEAVENSSQSDIDSVTTTDPLSLLEEIVTDLANMLKRLYRIATRLNNQTSSTQNSASWKHKVVNQDTGVDLLDVRAEYDRLHLSDAYPQMEKFLVRRLASANVARRRRLAYWRTNRENVVKTYPRKRPPNSINAEIERETIDQTQARVSTIATILEPSRFLLDNAPADLDESVNIVMADDDMEELGFPDLPDGALEGAVFECPYCFILLGPTMTRRAWR